MSKFIGVFSLAFVLTIVSLPAQAYIDPGSGSMILQGLLAALAAIAVTAKLWWHRLLVLLHIRKRTVVPPLGDRSGVSPQSKEKDE